MKTTKPFATISYNSVPFLMGKLDDLIRDEIITFYAFIQHKPEEDEEKMHCHVYCKPAKQVDLLWLRKQFLQPDPTHPDKPLGCLPLERSDFANWYWYVLHDPVYLASKGQARKYQYHHSAVITSDPDYLGELVRTNPRPTNEMSEVRQMLIEGYSPFEIAEQMNVKVRNLSYFLNGVVMVSKSLGHVTYRGDRKPHEEVVGLIEDEEDEEQ